MIKRILRKAEISINHGIKRIDNYSHFKSNFSDYLEIETKRCQNYLKKTSIASKRLEREMLKFMPKYPLHSRVRSGKYEYFEVVKPTGTVYYRRSDEGEQTILDTCAINDQGKQISKILVSNDETRVAYLLVSEDQEQGDLYIQNISGFFKSKIKISSVFNFQWSPDDRHILFTRLDSKLHSSQVWAVSCTKPELQELVYSENEPDMFADDKSTKVLEISKPFNVNSNDFKVENIIVDSSDANVPVQIIYRKSILRNSKPHHLQLLRMGFVLAIPHVRGGSDVGTKWHEDGKKMHKMNTFLDIISTAKYLINQGYTDTSLLAGEGSSAGGLAFAAVANMEPDLFKALLLRSPFLDPLSAMLDESSPLTISEREEWGDPISSEAVYQYIESYSPYENLRKLETSMLITAGLNDERVHITQSLKYVAKAREFGNDCILRVHPYAHFSSQATAFKDYAIEIAFLQFEVSPFLNFAFDRMESRSTFVNVQHLMNMNHFEQLMYTFKQHSEENGEDGFDIDKFREVFGKILGGNLTHDQMTMLFMKIDANSDGSLSWDEFSTYMMTANSEEEEQQTVVDERRRKLVVGLHKDMIIRIEYVAKERKYLTVSRDGIICIWTLSAKLYKIVSTRDFNPRQAWVLDAKYMPECSRLVVVTDNRQMCFFDLFSIKPRLIAVISYLENNPLCLALTSDYDVNTDLLIYGDDGGYVNVLTINRRCLVENTSDDGPNEHLNPSKISRKDSLERYNMFLYRRKIHSEWVLKVQYYKEMNAFVSCSLEDDKSLVIGDLERKTLRHITVSKGIETFEFCRRPSFLITGGRDKVIRLWNPYVLSKPAGSLYGHNSSIVQICVNHEDGVIFSLSEDKVVKLWNARNLNCIQTVIDKVPHRPENTITAMYYDTYNRQLMTGSGKLEIWPLFPNVKHNSSRSHDAPIVAALFNSNFNQVVSGSQNGDIILWDPTCGEKIFEFHRAHGSLELTAMCFDISGRRLITGSRDKVLKMWNFNNGQILRKMHKETAHETTDICYIEMGSNQYIIAAGWDRKITMFLEDNDNFESFPTKVLNGSGMRGLIGHEDDISCITFCAPNILASSSIDGAIVIWNLESGSMRTEKNDQLKRPLGDQTPLFTCYADGCLRIWDIHENKLLKEYNCQLLDDEGLTCISYNSDATILAVGGSYGHVRLVDLKNLLECIGDQSCEVLNVIKHWRSHVQSLVGVGFVETHDLMLTCAKDAVVRLWTKQGLHLGSFGDQPWHFFDHHLARLPKDLQIEYEEEEKERETATQHETVIKKKIISRWKGEEEEPILEVTNNDHQMKKLRAKAIKAHVCRLFKAKWNRQKGSEDWQLHPEQISVKRSKKFFSFDYQSKERKSKPSINFGQGMDLENVVFATSWTTEYLNRVSDHQVGMETEKISEILQSSSFPLASFAQWYSEYSARWLLQQLKNKDFKVTNDRDSMILQLHELSSEISSLIKSISKPLSLFPSDCQQSCQRFIKDSIYLYIKFDFKAKMLKYLEGFDEFLTDSEKDIEFQVSILSEIVNNLSEQSIVEVLESSLVAEVEKAIEKQIVDNLEITDESLSPVLEFLHQRIMPIITAVHGKESLKSVSWQYRLESLIYRSVGMNLSGVIFEIVREYPDSLPSLRNLCSCLERSGEYDDMKVTLNNAIKSRLLIIDAKTQDILNIYLATKHSLSVLNLQENVKQEILNPIQEYLQTRADCSSKIILQILEHSDLENEEPLTEDDIETLMDIFPSKAVFAKDYQTILSSQLTRLSDFNVDDQIRHVEMLKSRFGDLEMSQVSVMMKDVADSRRIYNHYITKPDSEDTFSALIISRFFWPKFTHASCGMPEMLTTHIKRYEASFEEIKASRKLNWIPTAGVVDLEVSNEKGPMRLQVTPLQATVLLIFEKVDEIELADVEQRTDCPVKQIVEAIEFWKTHNILDIVGTTIYSIQSIPKARLKEILNIDETVESHKCVLPQLSEKVDMIWPMVQGMLTNLGPSNTFTIHQTLEMFRSEIFQYDMSEGELQSVLEAMVEQEKLEIEVDTFRIKKRDPLLPKIMTSSQPAEVQVPHSVESNTHANIVVVKPKKANKRMIKWIKSTAGIKTKPPKPLFPPNSLSITERYFHKTHMENEAQVIMMVGSRVLMPRKARHLSLKRIIDICKLTQAEFYRTASTVEFETQVMIPMGATAADLRIEYSFTPFVDASTTAEAIKHAINYRYNIKDSSAPLWRIDIVGHPDIVEGITLAEDSQEVLPNFYIYFSFHHCLGDGLSAFSYAKEVFRNFHAANFNLPDLHLDTLAVTPVPPPLLDNLIKANFLEIIPAAIDMLSAQAKKQREKKHQLKQFAEPLPNQEHTSNLRRLVFDAQYSEDLRKNCRDNGTTVAAALIVAALAAVRAVFGPRAEKKGKPLPKYQSWVVTSSMRHLLPNSSLLQGSDKETDPGTKEFGGYGGSISDEKFKFTEKSEVWERCKKVKKHLNSSFFPSMRRMKLMNYVYRKPKLWNSLQKKVDLEAVTRTYAVEMANLGAWEYPCAPLDAPESDERIKMDDFYGAQNNSFKGCRAFFSVAVVSIGNVMSVLVTFDQAAITEPEADIFIQSFEKVLNHLRSKKDTFSLSELQ
ncbi:WD40 repeat domain 95 [Boothiomyces macroporosus]|uniref:Anaphase-promoting complex subunit 2 n=1 Tax=Boothiomyces macroporosus TaxID=261099 RepID=A0AAD5UMP4_9FUNG|nr:WD40 repeat domain 95 [Boothiomyces macroporosus]